MNPVVFRRQVSRVAPAIAVLALLSLAAAAPTVPGVAPPPQLQPPCTEFASAVAGDSTVGIPYRTAIEQALPPMMSVAACSLRAIAPINTFLKLTLHDWDPTTLAPDPDAIALRRAFFDGSQLGYANGGKLPRVSFVPPIVLSSVPDVAEPPKPQVAMQLSTEWTYYSTPFGYLTPEGPVELPAAVKVNTDGSREPLPGPHPVLAHAVCSGGDDLASLRVVQAVSRTDVKPFPSPREFAQRFRVPQQVEVRWIELAMAGFISFGGTYNDPGVQQRPILAIVDGESLPRPPLIMPPPLVEAPVDLSALSSSSFNGPVWGSHLDFDRTVTLEPDHDYWIYVREAATSTFMNRRVHGDEPPAFTAGIGPYFCRADSAGPWNQTADQVLAFRIVARAIAPPPPPPIARPAAPPTPPLPGTAAFALNATPNPAPGAVRVDWSGAVGPVRCEVLDARGRRLAEGTGGAAGAWTWQGTDRDGRAVASGVYFVRARDSAGRASNQRVMIVR